MLSQPGKRSLLTHKQALNTMKYTIKKFNAPSTRLNHNDKIVPDRYGDSGDFDTEEDGHPVVVMESGVKSFDGTGCEYHEKRGVLAEPAKTWQEAVSRVGIGEDERLADNSPINGTLQSGPDGVDYWAVEVLTLID